MTAEMKKYEIFSQNILFFLLIILVIYYFCEFPKTEANNYEFEKIFRKRLSVWWSFFIWIFSVNKFVSEKLLNYMEIEKLMHNNFKDFRVRGEWFNVDFNIVVETFASVMPKTQVPMMKFL